MKFLFLLFAIIHLAFANNNDGQFDSDVQARFQSVCYTGYGCYTTSPPFFDLFVRPIVYLPQSPDKVGTKFFLYTQSNPKTAVEINSANPSEFFRANGKTRFIVHGFIDYGTKPWIIAMKDALLRNENSNVIVVDWSKGNQFPYEQATANTQIVGTEISLLVNSYVSKGLVSVDDVHIIGHSLGSHIAGYAGERITPKIGRITGLDPAGPGFENGDIRIRLDPSDAKFVDVIHSDGAATLQLGLGMMQASGHVDFYPNGGKDQPSCGKTSGKLLGAIFGLLSFDMNAIEDAVACSHMAAVHFYTNSIESRTCSYTAYPCGSLKDFTNSQCITCTGRGCNRMGHWASENNDRGSLYLTTQDANAKLYCYNHLKVSAVSNSLSGQVRTKGLFTVTIHGSLRSTAFLIENGDTLLTTNQAINYLGESTVELGAITKATISFKKAPCFLICFTLDDQWSFRNVIITDGQTQNTIRLCPTRNFIASGTSADFTLC